MYVAGVALPALMRALWVATSISDLDLHRTIQ
jgi:hypothetical protein